MLSFKITYKWGKLCPLITQPALSFKPTTSQTQIPLTSQATCCLNSFNSSCMKTPPIHNIVYMFKSCFSNHYVRCEFHKWAVYCKLWHWVGLPFSGQQDQYLLHVVVEGYAHSLPAAEHFARHQGVEDSRAGQGKAEVEAEEPPVLHILVELRREGDRATSRCLRLEFSGTRGLWFSCYDLWV